MPLLQGHAQGAYMPTDFFETCAMLITLVLFGKYLEAVVSHVVHAKSAVIWLVGTWSLLLMLLDWWHGRPCWGSVLSGTSPVAKRGRGSASSSEGLRGKG